MQYEFNNFESILNPVHLYSAIFKLTSKLQPENMAPLLNSELAIMKVSPQNCGKRKAKRGEERVLRIYWLSQQLGKGALHIYIYIYIYICFYTLAFHELFVNGRNINYLYGLERAEFTFCQQTTCRLEFETDTDRHYRRRGFWQNINSLPTNHLPKNIWGDVPTEE